MNNAVNCHESTRQQFLLTEMQHVTASFLRNEDFGEGRLNLLLAIAVGGAAAFIALLEQNELSSEVLVAAIAGVVLLLLFGWQTFRRILARNVETDQLTRSLRLIRCHFVPQDDSETLRMLAYPPYGESKPPRSQRKMNPFQSDGGLAELTMLLNSFVAAIAVAFSVPALATREGLNGSELFASITGVFVGCFVFGLHVLFARHYYRRKEGHA